jgi:hypothetical protein
VKGRQPVRDLWRRKNLGRFASEFKAEVPRRGVVLIKIGKPFTLKQGETIQTRAGVLIHKGDVQTGHVAERYQAYAVGKL